jgi:hypothetical protein
MIIKVLPNGGSFGGVMSYLLDCPRSVAGEVIDTNMAGVTSVDYADQMEWVAGRNGSRRSGPVWHTIVSWHKDDRVSSDQMAGVVQGLLMHLEIDPEKHQDVVVQHRDEDEPHLHLVLNRVSEEGSLFLGKQSGLKADVYREHCEQQYGWTVARGRGKPEEPSRTQAEIHLEQRMPRSTAKHLVHTAVGGAIAASDGTFAGFVKQCQVGGQIVPDLSFNEAGFNGASFALLSHLREGEPEMSEQGIPYVFKGSQSPGGRIASRRRSMTAAAHYLSRAPRTPPWPASGRCRGHHGRPRLQEGAAAVAGTFPHQTGSEGASGLHLQGSLGRPW